MKIELEIKDKARQTEGLKIAPFRQHIINEAKRLLLYTDITVSEIAHRLDFKDNSHFSKYFKRYVEQTPIAFRSDHN